MSEATATQLFTCANCGLLDQRQKYCTRCGALVGSAEPLRAPRITPEFQPPGVEVPALRERLPRVAPQGGRKTLHWVGVHGGAGESTLSRALSGSVSAGAGWPTDPSGPQTFPDLVPVVLVTRSHGAGLMAAQNAIREWAAGSVRPVELLGLVVIADSPIRLPKELRELQRLVAGGAPNFWPIPYIDSLRLTPEKTIAPNRHKSIERVCVSIQAIIDSL